MANTRRIRCYNETESKEFETGVEAAEFLNTTTSSIGVALKTGKKYLGYSWCYVDDDSQIIQYLRHNSNLKVIYTDYEHINEYVDPAVITPPNRNDDILSDLDHIPGEVWAQIPGYPPCYISNYSRIKLHIGNDLYRLLEQNPVLINDNYYMTTFLSDGIQLTRCRVDRIVYATFVDPKFPIYQWKPEYDIKHIDGNTLNNDRENLLKIKLN